MARQEDHEAEHLRSRPNPAGGDDALRVEGRRSMPRHVAVIMDGNGRWAAMRGLPRAEGHRRGVEALRRVVRAAGDLGLEYLTVFSFSTENWRRPSSEISFLIGLLKRFVEKDLAELHASDVRVKMIGNRSARLSPDIIRLIEHAESLTRDNSGLTLVIAFNYGARDELVRAAQRVAAQVANGSMTVEQIDEATLSGQLDNPEMPDPDLLIRTSGEQRISNFLLWQMAYTELVFTPTLWPDFDGTELTSAIESYMERDRRYGGLAAEAG
jgi:undecaprenyl diphosphate synthase